MTNQSVGFASRKENNLSCLGRVWAQKPADERIVMALAQVHKLPVIVAQILASRGFDQHNVAGFLNPTIKESLPDPSVLKDMDVAVARIISAVENNEKISIFGDYDVDGATSTALLSLYLQSIGVHTEVYIPDRTLEGYGPSISAFDKFIKNGTQLIITVDCGTTAFDALAYAADKKTDVIVIDHHVGEPKLPQAVAIINPNRLDENQDDLCGLAAVGVSFVLLVALNRSLRQNGFFASKSEPNLIQYLDLVALGTVCDVMPLKGLNRAIVSQGLKVMTKRQNTGLKALADCVGIDAQPSAYHLGFMLGPRINAGGRVGEASLGSELLRTNVDAKAIHIAARLDGFNITRKEIEQDVLTEALLQAEKQDASVICVSGTDWHPGVIGIVAGRLKERYSRPACVISLDGDGVGKGSSRSVTGFDLGASVHAAKQMGLLEAGGGHAMAAGLTIKSDKITEFQEFLSARFDKAFADGYTPETTYDAVLHPKGLNGELCDAIECMAPFGTGNPTPKFVVQGMNIQKTMLVGEQHMRVIATHMDGTRLDGIAFRVLDTPIYDLCVGHKGRGIDILGSVKRDSWQGREKIQFIIDDMCLSFS